MQSGERAIGRHLVGTPALFPPASPHRVDCAAWRAPVRLAAFFTVSLVAILATHICIQAGLRSVKTSGFGVTNRIVDGQVNADIVICGSSRALNHFDPRVIQAITGHSAFNIGRNGSQTDMQQAMLETYLIHNAAPKLVVQNLDLFTFVATHEIYDPVQYVPYLGEAPIFEAVRQIQPQAWKWKYLPLYGYAVEDLRLSWLLGLRGLGFEPRQTPWTGDFEKFQKSHPDGVRTAIEPKAVQSLEALIRTCAQRRIPLLLVYSPEYSEIQKMERDRDAVFSRFRELSARSHAPLWDFSRSVICSNRDYFYNSQHLNADGAKAFSEAFARRLVFSGPFPGVGSR